MAITNFADRHLTIEARRLTTGRAAQRLTADWIGDAHLDGWTPSSLLVALTKREHPDHDVLMRGLITHSQQHDEDASLLLLAALRPAIWKLAHTYHRPRLHAAFDDLLVSAVHVIARADPSVDRLYDRVVGRIRAATPPLRPDVREECAAEFDDRAMSGEDEIVDQIEAREELRRLAQLRKSGVLADASWCDLVAVRLHGVPVSEVARGRTTHHVRADVSRFSRRLERILAA